MSLVGVLPCVPPEQFHAFSFLLSSVDICISYLVLGIFCMCECFILEVSVLM